MSIGQSRAELAGVSLRPDRKDCSERTQVIVRRNGEELLGAALLSKLQDIPVTRGQLVALSSRIDHLLAKGGQG